MLLNKTEIEAAKVIDDSRVEGFSAASYDLHAGYCLEAAVNSSQLPALLHGTNQIPEHGIILKPQGMVRVVSSEYIRMPPDVVGFAVTKNGLSNKCVLAINIGIIDPGYCGPISSTLINFGKEEFCITRDTQFLRLTFQRCSSESPTRKLDVLTHKEYVARTAQEVKSHAASTFLDMDSTARKVGKLVIRKYRSWVLFVAVIAAFGLALLSIFAPLGAAILQKYIDNSQIQAGQEIRSNYEKQLQRIEGDNRKQIEELQGRIRSLELKK